MKDHETQGEVYSSEPWDILLFCKAKGSGDFFAGWPCPVQSQLCLEILARMEYGADFTGSRLSSEARRGRERI